MKNRFFKDWKKANDFLNAFIDDHFGIYLSRPTPDCAYITFLPEDKLATLIPCEQAPALNERARKFTEHMNNVLKKHKMLEDIPDDIIYSDQELSIKLRFESFFKLYESIYKQPVVVTLKQYLGLREKYDLEFNNIKCVISVGG